VSKLLLRNAAATSSGSVLPAFAMPSAITCTAA